MAFVLPVPDPVTVPVAGTDDLFPVRRIFCVGRNYEAHAREMGLTEREPPFFFAKFADAIRPNGSVLPYPPLTEDFHHEGELVVAIGKGGRDIAAADALAHVFGYAAGLDMTRRDVQWAAKKAGKPWDMGKNFPGAAPISTIHPIAQTGPLERGALVLTVNGTVRQQGDLADMIWSIPETIAHLSRYGALEAGDLIFTGTPAGVGPVLPGDRIDLRIDGLTPLTVSIGPAD